MSLIALAPTPPVSGVAGTLRPRRASREVARLHWSVSFGEQSVR